MTLSTNAIDLHIGRLIRAHRRAVGFNQAALGARIGVSFQQVQKYESGANRVTAAQLCRIAWAVDAAPASLLDGVLDLIQAEALAVGADHES